MVPDGGSVHATRPWPPRRLPPIRLLAPLLRGQDRPRGRLSTAMRRSGRMAGVPWLRGALAACLSASLLTGCLGPPATPTAPPAPPRASSVPGSLPGTPPREDPGLCQAALWRTRADFVPVPDRELGHGCGYSGAVRLLSLGSDDAAVHLDGLGPIACPLANALSGWLRYGADRAARQILGSPLVRIETMGSYACRPVAGTLRLSAHARANAVDVAAFVLADGRRISVARAWTLGSAGEQRFLRTIRASACKRFATVLSPDYDAAHRDHLHFETGAGSFCR